MGQFSFVQSDEWTSEVIRLALADTEQRVYDALPARGARTLDETAVASGLPATQVLGPLAVLELSGLVVCQDGRWKLPFGRLTRKVEGRSTAGSHIVVKVQS